MAEFIYVTTTVNFYSYGRRSLGLQFGACTPPVDLPAPGRCHTLYIPYKG